MQVIERLRQQELKREQAAEAVKKLGATERVARARELLGRAWTPEMEDQHELDILWRELDIDNNADFKDDLAAFHARYEALHDKV